MHNFRFHVMWRRENEEEFRDFFQTNDIYEAKDFAMRLAFERLRADVHLRLENSELVSQRVDGAFTNEGYLLKCELTYIENIAETIEFSVN